MMSIERFAEALREHESIDELVKDCRRYGMLCSHMDHDPDGGDAEFTYNRYGYRVVVTKSYGRVTGIRSE